MSHFFRAIVLLAVLFPSMGSFAQTTVKGKIIDASTKEPIAGASIHCTDADCRCGCVTNEFGEFEMKCMGCTKLSASSIGYGVQQFLIGDKTHLVQLNAAASQLQQVIFTANRGEGVKRSEAPVAIASITSKTLQETKPTMADR